MKRAEANIEIRRRNGNIQSIKLVIPVWNKFVHEDNVISVDLPLFGLKTWAKDGEDVNTAIGEVLTLFFRNAERFGKGVANELKSLGWEVMADNGKVTLMSFRISTRNEVMTNLINTGESNFQDLQLAS